MSATLGLGTFLDKSRLAQGAQHRQSHPTEQDLGSAERTWVRQS